MHLLGVVEDPEEGEVDIEEEEEKIEEEVIVREVAEERLSSCLNRR